MKNSNNTIENRSRGQECLTAIRHVERLFYLLLRYRIIMQIYYEALRQLMYRVLQQSVITTKLVSKENLGVKESSCMGKVLQFRTSRLLRIETSSTFIKGNLSSIGEISVPCV
jgi:hypothetical protein